MSEKLSVGEAARYADFSKDHIRRLIRDKKIVVEKIETPTGFYYLIERDSLDTYIHTPALRKPGKKKEKPSPETDPGPGSDLSRLSREVLV